MAEGQALEKQALEKQGLDKQDLQKQGLENVRAISNVMYVTHVACVRCILAVDFLATDFNTVFLLAAAPFAMAFARSAPPRIGARREEATRQAWAGRVAV
jgi:hypothetical protein